MNKNIIELKVENKVKNLEKYIRPQWSWKTLFSIVLFCFALIFVVKDLEINFIKSLSVILTADEIATFVDTDFSQKKEKNKKRKKKRKKNDE